ncbi:MAG: OmpA family protein [Gammaproteobacteria bacterium]
MTDHRTTHCTLCILIPLILGIIGLALLYWYTKENKASYIENDLSLKSNQLLEQQQVGGVIVRLDGRDAILSGTVVSENRSNEVEQIIAALSGIRVVDNQLEIAIPETEVVPETEPEPQPEQEQELKIEPEAKTIPTTEKQPEPEIALASVTQTETVRKLLHTLDLSVITFLFSSYEITTKGELVLDDVASVLAAHPDFKVLIEGHTDSVGDDDLNFEFSQQRAQSVLVYLENMGIHTERLSATGFVESQPIAENDTIEGRAPNRRIDFSVSRKL